MLVLLCYLLSLCHGLNVTFMFPGPITDYTWNYEHDFAAKSVRSTFPQFSYTSLYDVIEQAETYKDQHDGADYDDGVFHVCNNVVAAGAEVVIVPEYTFYGGISRCADKYENVKFVCVSCPLLGKKNGVWSFGRAYESRYLNGILAALMTKTNTIGYVAPVRSPEVFMIFNAFAIAVREFRPEAQVLVHFTDSFEDIRKARQGAEKLQELGCDIIAFHVQVKEVYPPAIQEGVLVLGYYTDLGWLYGPAVLSSSIFRWYNIYFKYLTQIESDTFQGESQEWLPGIRDDVVDVITPSHLVPDDVRAIHNERREMVKAGEIIYCGDVLVELRIRKFVNGSNDCLVDTDLASFNTDDLLNNSAEVNVTYYYIELGNGWDQIQSIAILIIIPCTYLVFILYSLLLFHKRDTDVVKASTIPFVGLITVSSMIGTTGGFFFVSPPSSFTCMAGYWFAYLGFVVSMACFIAKNARLYFIEKNSKSLSEKPIPTWQLTFPVIICGLIMTVILVIWTSVGSARLEPFTWHAPDLEVYEAYWYCEADNDYIFIATINSFIIVLFAAAIYFSWRTRNFISLFRESEKVAMAVWLVFVMEIILLPLIYTFDISNWQVKNFLLALIAIWQNFIPYFVVITPKLWLAYVTPEKNKFSGSLSKPRDSSSSIPSSRG